MIRLASTGVFLDPDDLATVRMLVLVAGRAAADVVHADMPLSEPLFANPAEAAATLNRINGFRSLLQDVNAW